MTGLVLIVNNNAASVFLILNDLQNHCIRELIQIGDSDPDIMAQSGTTLVEGGNNQYHQLMITKNNR